MELQVEEIAVQALQYDQLQVLGAVDYVSFFQEGHEESWTLRVANEAEAYLGSVQGLVEGCTVSYICKLMQTNPLLCLSVKEWRRATVRDS